MDASPANAELRSDPARDPLAADIVQAVHDLEDGRFTRARVRLEPIWTRLNDADCSGVESVHRCAVAHWLGAAQGELTAKLEWDERALSEAESVPDWSTIVAGTGHSIGAIYADLHLELARDYLRLNEACAVLEHLAIARNAVEVLPAERRRRLGKELARIDAELDRRAPAPEDWGWERWSEEDLAADEVADDDDGAG
jgi:hypothetical protein